LDTTMGLPTFGESMETYGYWLQPAADSLGEVFVFELPDGSILV
jgi:hypothetical protein